MDTFNPVTHRKLFCLVTAQMTANKGVKLFGVAGEQAIEKELRQLLTRDVMHGVDSQTLTREQRRAALRYLMFLKQKRCGTIKGRGCADGRKQRLYKTKEETSSPALSIEALFLSCVIDAYERRYVLTCDIPGAFMQAKMDELLHLKLDGTILEILLRMDPSYCQYVTYENGKKVLYAQLDKALYGAVQSALLFWKKLTAFVVDVLGFEINPYDECVANKIIKGKQCTIAWYVDDLKLSHEDPTVVEDIFTKLQAEFGKEAPLTVTRGKVHNYLGMRIDYSIDGKVQFTMPSLVKEIVAQLPSSLSSGPCATPAGNHFFVVNKNAQKLSQTNSDLLHRMTTQLLYLCKRARPDLQTAVAFLTTRVVAPDCDDMKKLGRCVRYLRRTAHLPLVLEASCVNNIRWWVDASYAVHPDMRSHTGATMTLGKGSVYSMSTRQKINTRSSTEAELVGVNDAMSIILWTRHFLEAQGYSVKENVVYQDNESAILLEKNGRRSSTKRTRHLDVRYFFVTDNVHRGKLSIEYCPTGDMIADYFTKPLQGLLFRKMLKQILNIDDSLIDSSPQECVGIQGSQGVTGQSRTRQADSTPQGNIEESSSNSAESAETSSKSFLVKNRSYADVVCNREKV
ncbi:reverse transcriptase RNA-dependent DNA polymerase [Nitzschia inconspicua]|uniref:Reverse transcriptase RNA-dependent DNA polymerase n=1 Tax=Nitzschia inconspicua TaxID=303405 RepID=A0A9K3LNJ7_9STRA|nr:reverse transcriptase RNA-dependent DNA polymerase [Nitzschia inconspicua]